MTTAVLIANLADIVSKNGNLLLNVGLKSDGTIPDNQREVREAVRLSLERKGQAIYGTPKGCDLFAILSGWPGDGDAIHIEALSAQVCPEKVQSVELLGRTERLTFRHDGSGLTVTLPPMPTGEHACVRKIDGVL